MGMLARWLRPSPVGASVGWGALDDRWYQPAMGIAQTEAGVAVGPETIYRCAAVLAAVRFLANSVAICPSHTYRDLGENSRRLATEHPVHRLMRHPHPRYTGFRWMRQQVTWASTWGNAYNRIYRDPGSDEIVRLEPIHPSWIRESGQAADGSLLYEYRDRSTGVAKDPVILRQWRDVLHFSGISTDGIAGAKIYQLMRNAIGVAIAAENHGGTFFRKGTRVSGILTTEQKLEPALRDAIATAWNGAFGGNAGAGGTAVVGSGFKFEPVSVDNQKSQFMELQDHQVETLLMFLGVPGVVVGYAGNKANTYASVKAYFQEGGLTGSILPWIENFEDELQAALFTAGDPHYIKLNMGVLARPDIVSQLQMLTAAAGGPIMTRNEARAYMDWNADPDPAMDEVLMPLNLSPGDPNGPGAPGGGGGGLFPSAEDEEIAPDDNGSEARQLGPAAVAEVVPPPPAAAPVPALDRIVAHSWLARELAAATARVLVSDEVLAIAGYRGGEGRTSIGAMARFAKEPDGLRCWLNDFYAKHAVKVSTRLGISEDAARAYAADQRGAVLAHGLAAVETWESTVPARLVALALGDETALGGAAS